MAATVTFAGTVLKCLPEAPRMDAPKLHAQRNQFPGIIGESQMILGVGGRDISIPVWLTDASFTSSQAVDSYRQALDLGVGATGVLQITGRQPMADVTFEGFELAGDILPAIGGAPLMPAGTYFLAGILHFHQNTPG